MLRERDNISPFARASEHLVFVENGKTPFRPHSVIVAEITAFKKDPATADVMSAIEQGPNAALYEVLTSKIQTAEFTEEKEEYLMQAASSIFFGNIITDANVEGIILCGGASKWRLRTEIDIFDMDPEYILLKYRIAEIKNGKFHLPQNNVDMEMNANEQITRITQQLADGTLERKAKKMGVSVRKGRKVGKNMIAALQEVRDSFI